MLKAERLMDDRDAAIKFPEKKQEKEPSIIDKQTTNVNCPECGKHIGIVQLTETVICMECNHEFEVFETLI